MLGVLPWIAGAGAVGAVLRWLLTRAATSWVILGVPMGVTVVNAMGCLLAGAFLGWSLPRTGVNEEVKIAVMVGFFGSFTTFSAMAGESFELFSAGRPAAAAAHLLLQNGIGVLVFGAGWWLGQRF